jgi:hypothetical protein
MRISLAVLVAAWAGAARAQTEHDGAWGSLYVIGSGGAWAEQGQTSKNGSGTLELDIYDERLSDDGAPYSLQTYLQRTSTLTIDLGGSAFSTTAPFFPTSYAGQGLSASASFYRYLPGLFTVSGGASIGYSASSGPTPTSLNPTYVQPSLSFGPGLRWGDTRLDLVYSFSPYFRDGSFKSNEWGRLFLSLESVLGRELFWQIDCSNIVSGLRGFAGVDWYPTRSFQIGGSVIVERGAVYLDNPALYTRVIPEVLLAYWFTPRLRGFVSYVYEVTDPVAQGIEIHQHRVTASLGVRLL